MLVIRSVEQTSPIQEVTELLKILIGAAAAAATAAGGVACAPAGNTGKASRPPTPPTAVVLSATASPTTAVCDGDSHWPGYVQGRPDGFDAHDDGAYIWHNPSGGWGLRVTHPLLPGPANRVVFAGAITSIGTIGKVVPVRNEKEDIVKVSPDGHTLSFRFVDYGWVDGVDFITSCTPGLRFRLAADGASMPLRFVHLGQTKVHPGSDPFRVRRVDTDTGTVAG